MSLFRRKKKGAPAPKIDLQPKPGVTAKGIPGGLVVVVLHDSDSCTPFRLEARFKHDGCDIASECLNPYVHPRHDNVKSGRDARLLAEFYSKVAAIFDQREVAS